MATLAGSPAAMLPRAEVVGNAFVQQYYHTLHQSPELVYKFYQDSSVLSRPDSDGIMTSVTTMQAINERIQSLDYKNYKAEIKTADAQESYQTGVIVLVTGCLTGTDGVRKEFAQTFFLAPQEGGYFVLNDVFRYVDDESEKLKIASELVHGINNSAATAQVTSSQEPTQAPDNSALDPPTTIEPEDLHNSTEINNRLENEERSVPKEEVINEPPTHSSQHETGVSESSASKEIKSYASIVNKAATTSSSASAPGNLRWAPTNNANQQARVSAKPSSQPELSASSIDTAAVSRTPDEVEGHSVYVRNLPVDASVSQLEEAFKHFGPIKRGGIQVKSNKQQGFCFGFVEFQLLDSMQGAIKESPIMIGGRQAVVEEKRTTSRGGGSSSSGRGRFASGRGGFRNDIRGRGGDFSNRGGYGRSEFRNQGEFASHPRVGPTGRTVESYRRVDQNVNNGRFSRQASHQPIEA